MKLTSGDSSLDVSLGEGAASLGGRAVPFSARGTGAAVAAIETGGETVPVRAVREGERIFVWCGEQTWEFRIEPAAGAARARARPSAADSAGLLSPMPGRIRRVLAAVGDAVSRGQVLMILEAMKMEHSIRSPRDGRLVRLACAEGDLVEAGVALAEIEE
ncbi:MAG: hypothetical protein M3S32_11915 [Acidobacteriota bacterium]|nr:hypothetical protein [Acidobacteriota bacterium]